MLIRMSATLRFLTQLFFLTSVSGVPQLLQHECDNKTIYDFIVSENLSPTISFDDDGSNFNILANLLATGNNAGVLNISTHGGITLFAPNDEAMVRTAQDLGYEGGGEYEGYQYIVSYLSERYESPIGYLFNMPMYHIVDPSMNSTEIFMKTSFATWNSGLQLQRRGLQLIDRNPELPDAELVPEMLDICMSNGFIHVINRVLFSDILNQTDESSNSHGLEEEPCVEHSEQPMYSREDGDLVETDSLPGPTIEAVAHKGVEETPFDNQSSMSALSRYLRVGPVDLTGTMLHTVSSSDLPLSPLEVMEEDNLIETQEAELLASVEPTLQLSPLWTRKEVAESTPVLHEATGYSLEPSASLDDGLYPALSPAISAEFPTPVSLSEIAPTAEVHEGTVNPSALPSSPITQPSNSETPDASEPEPTTLESFTDESSPNDVIVTTSPVPTLVSHIDPVQYSPESTTADVLEGSASPGQGIDHSLEISPTEPSQIADFPDIDGCFPRTATVHLSVGNDIHMHELRAGHSIMSGESKSSTVYMFSHRQPVGLHPFVRIESKDNHTIELSPDHYIYANGRLVIAQQVKVGDMLRTLDGPSKVSTISRVNRTGLYAPHTMHGDIVVGRIVASTYTSALPYWVAHPVLEVIRLPVRFGIAKEPIGSLLYDGCTKWRDIRTWIFGVPQTM